ncbi:MAG: retroviral-like aspartic protease family protein [Pyrinomonadaceae bacterium]
MPAYDSALFSPPAPLAHVTLRNPESGATRNDVPMLIDTGADVTLLPQNAASEIGLTVLNDKNYELMGFEGQASVAVAVRAEMILLGLTFRGQFLLIEQDWGIIGRNVLNSLALVLNGPQLTWNQANIK